jgi:hypothetical protein
MQNLYVIRDDQLKLTLPGHLITIKADGTIWYSGTPLLGIIDPIIKAQASAAVLAGRYDQVPADAYTRLGDNPNGLWAGDEVAWDNHPAKRKIEIADAERTLAESRRVTIYLSSRGWGDYTPCNWIGDITRPIAAILAECKIELASGIDIDQPDQSDAEVLAKISQARKQWQTPKVEYRDPDHGPGYCYNCETYCYGDCGDYRPKPDYRRDIRRAMDEANYGIMEDA